MRPIQRRTFLMGSAASGTTLLGANDRINLAVVGPGGRGTDDVNEYLSSSLDAASPGPHMASISDRMGRKLQFDPVKERFVKDAGANRLVSRDYRKAYMVPENV
jgi:hypothetical protein